MGLGVRKFGGFLTWFLQGGGVYTTYSFIAIPALVFGAGARVDALPFLIITYPVVFIFLPRLWQLQHHQGYVTSSDFVRDRFGHPLLSLLVTVTGIVAILPYAALQVYGIEVSIAGRSGFRSPPRSGRPSYSWPSSPTSRACDRPRSSRSSVKDVLIWITRLVAVIYIPIRLGGYVHIFNSLPRSSLTLARLSPRTHYLTLAIGSGLASFLFLDPHTITGAGSWPRAASSCSATPSSCRSTPSCSGSWPSWATWPGRPMCT